MAKSSCLVGYVTYLFPERTEEIGFELSPTALVSSTACCHTEILLVFKENISFTRFFSENLIRDQTTNIYSHLLPCLFNYSPLIR